MFNGIDAFSFLGASGNPDVPGLGFRYDTDERWPYPNPTGLRGRHGRNLPSLHSEEFRQCVALQAQYVLDTFGKFPGTVPSIFLIMHLQAHHVDLDFYDRFFKPGSCLKTHADHMKTWHPAG